MKRKLMFCTVLLFVLMFPSALNAQNKVAKSASTVTDIDGNVYRTVKIGTQVWMAENLKTTKYRNGDPIPNVRDNESWKALTTGAYCWYNNDGANKASYGGLYNWFAVADIRKIAPKGWHVASDAEWSILTDFLGGTDVAGGKMKEAGTNHWNSPNNDATNSSGFTALPSSSRGHADGSFDVGYFFCFWWSNAVGDTIYEAWPRGLYYNSAGFSRGGLLYAGWHGYSVRCVKD